MSEDDAVLDAALRERSQRPFLYSWNRKVQHLHGVSVRNLNLSPISRLHRQTITEDEVPSSLASPAKRLHKNELLALHEAHSFSPSSRKHGEPPSTPPRSGSTFEMPARSVRPGGKMRRRSTLHWTGASPRARQRKLEDVAAPRMVDSWFSIHHNQAREPVYISEVMEKSMNPTFSSFDLECIAPAVARSDHCILRLWAKTERKDDYSMLVEMDFNLRSLQYLGRSLDTFHHPLPQNCILLHLEDGVYTNFTDIPTQDDVPVLEAHTENPAFTSSFDALLQLANLDECIQDALKTREKLESDMNALLLEKQSSRTQQPSDPKSHKTDAVRDCVRMEEKQITLMERRKEEVTKSHRARIDAMRVNGDNKTAGDDLRRRISDCETRLLSEMKSVGSQKDAHRRRICEAISMVFPIDAIKNRPLHFTICRVYLPNSVFDDTNRDEIAAGLGFTAQAVHLLALYLSVSLPYPIEPNASESFIRDPISISLAQRRFPLHPTNVAYKFEYGVFLLNKDIEFLMQRCGLRVLDPRHTLPNLKYLLYVLSAGTEELPARKAGGFRGLLGGYTIPELVRRGSEESVLSASDTLSTRGGSFDLSRAGSMMPNSLSKELDHSVEDPSIGLGRGRNMPYRRSLLREAS